MRTRHLPIVALIALLAACPSDSEPGVSVPVPSADVPTADIAGDSSGAADTASPPTDVEEPADSAAPADTQNSPDTQEEADLPGELPSPADEGTPPADAGEPDALPPTDAKPGSCESIAVEIDALVGSLQDCENSPSCQLFEFPICGSAGCFQRPIALDADTSALVELANAGQQAQCEPFHCGCGWPGGPACIAGTCRLCPGPDCTGTCQDLAQALVDTANQGKSCTGDEQCTVLDTPFCDVPGLGCYGIALGPPTQPANALGALIDVYAEAGCINADCDCGPGVPKCVGGKCTLVD